MVIDKTKNICDNDRYKLIYESSADAIMTLAAPDWHFTSGNPATIKMFGLKTEKEFTDLSPNDLSPEYQSDGSLSSDKSKEMINKAMEEGQNTFSWIHKRYKGDVFPAQVTLVKMVIDGKDVLQATVRDMTEQDKAEKALEAKIKELEKLTKLMVGRELKMVDLKKEIAKLKNGETIEEEK